VSLPLANVSEDGMALIAVRMEPDVLKLVSMGPALLPTLVNVSTPWMKVKTVLVQHHVDLLFA